MATVGFGICLVISLLTLVYMLHKNYDSVQIHYWSILLMNPIIILAYWLKTRIVGEEAARILFCFTNLDGIILLMLYVFAMCRGLGLKLKAWIKIAGYTIAFAHLGVIWWCVDNDLYYKTMTVIQTGYGSATKMVSGPLKVVHYVYIGIIVVAMICFALTGYRSKGRYSQKTMITYTSFATAALVIYILEAVLDLDFSLLPYLYTVLGLVMALGYENIGCHDIVGITSTHIHNESPRGYVAIGLNNTFLCANEKAYGFMPFLEKIRTDSPLEQCGSDAAGILELIEAFKAGQRSYMEFAVGDKTTRCEIDYFSVRKNGKRHGYLLDIRDATEEKRNLMILSDYNDMLNEEVAEKTQHITNIQKKIVLGMAEMIENRDNNTGGHVKRTSEIISILVDEVRKHPNVKIDDQMAEDIVRAAPMHDLGKLQIDSSILCKPGRLTDEEYAIMKTHSVTSGEMVKILLLDVEEKHFVDTAYNVARYHHERWDGKGYPDGLVGSMIPIEARIMAVADVYDALVSKRCYKEAMSFDEAADIMLKSMGTQFDPGMKTVFLNCREKMEKYYKK